MPKNPMGFDFTEWGTAWVKLSLAKEVPFKLVSEVEPVFVGVAGEEEFYVYDYSLQCCDELGSFTIPYSRVVVECKKCGETWDLDGQMTLHVLKIGREE